MNLTSSEWLSRLQFDDVVSDVRPGIAIYIILLAGSQPDNKADTCNKADLKNQRELEAQD